MVATSQNWKQQLGKSKPVIIDHDTGVILPESPIHKENTQRFQQAVYEALKRIRPKM